jgi:hypothetical protein
LAISVYGLLRGSDVVRKSELTPKLEESSKTVLKDYERQFRAVETEWADMYQKFMRLAGRMDRQKALEPAATTEASPPVITRSDILRQSRRRTNHVQTGTDSAIPV